MRRLLMIIHQLAMIVIAAGRYSRCSPRRGVEMWRRRSPYFWILFGTHAYMEGNATWCILELLSGRSSACIAWVSLKLPVVACASRVCHNGRRRRRGAKAEATHVFALVVGIETASLTSLRPRRRRHFWSPQNFVVDCARERFLGLQLLQYRCPLGAASGLAGEVFRICEETR